MERFIISEESCTIGFHEHVSLDLMKPISSQLNRHRLYHRELENPGDDRAVRKIIEQNLSLRIAFGWSFESTTMLEKVMQDCIEEVIPKYNTYVGNMCSDTRCDWLGFMPFDVFEREVYRYFSIYELIRFNNELVNFQEEVVQFISNHKIFRQHAIVRGQRFRFEYFKAARRDPVALSDAFLYYVDSVKATSLVGAVPRDILEEDIGCHFLYHPEVFFELLEFLILKGDICE